MCMYVCVHIWLSSYLPNFSQSAPPVNVVNPVVGGQPHIGGAFLDKYRSQPPPLSSSCAAAATCGLGMRMCGRGGDHRRDVTWSCWGTQTESSLHRPGVLGPRLPARRGLGSPRPPPGGAQAPPHGDRALLAASAGSSARSCPSRSLRCSLGACLPSPAAASSSRSPAAPAAVAGGGAALSAPGTKRRR